MNQRIYNLVIGSILILLFDTVLAQTTHRSFELRKRASLIVSINNAMRIHPPMTNSYKVEHDVIAVIKNATQDTLKTPLVVSSRYEPLASGGGMIWITWLEDRPTLFEITVVNPDTKKEAKLKIPDAEIKDILSYKEDEIGFIYSCCLPIPEGVAGGRSQVLEIRGPNQEFPANCYPSIFTNLDTTQPIGAKE